MVINKKNRNYAYLIAGIVLVFIFLQVVIVREAVKTTKNQFNFRKDNKNSPGWNQTHVNRLKKDILWFEQLLELSKTDSIYMSIDLNDSLIHLGLKGMNILKSKVVSQYPAGFLTGVNEELYLQFGVVSHIVNEKANFPKKSVRKVVDRIRAEDNNDIHDHSESENPLRWTFTTANQLRVVITGIKPSADSSFIINPVQDIVTYRLQEIIQQPVQKEFLPSVYLWLDDKDAKSVYRAISSRGNILFRN